MVYPMMVTLQMQKILTGGKARLQIVTQLINFSIIPFVAYGLGKVFFHDRPMTAFGKQGSDIALIIALAYIIQVQSAALYVKHTDRIFGKHT
jgi:ACR3 family arsenite efflux pump ArsB